MNHDQAPYQMRRFPPKLISICVLIVFNLGLCWFAVMEQSTVRNNSKAIDELFPRKDVRALNGKFQLLYYSLSLFVELGGRF